MYLSDEKIYLRAMEPEDAGAMYRWENDASLWELGGGVSRPFSRAVIRKFIEQASMDIFAAGQLRLMIVRKDTGQTIGCVDLFDFNPLMRRAGVGILIYEAEDRRQGYGLSALQLMTEYAFRHLDLRQLYADIPVSNRASRRLFSRVGFIGDTVRREWVRISGGRYEDALFVQLLRS